MTAVSKKRCALRRQMRNWLDKMAYLDVLVRSYGDYKGPEVERLLDRRYKAERKFRMVRATIQVLDSDAKELK